MTPTMIAWIILIVGGTMLTLMLLYAIVERIALGIMERWWTLISSPIRRVKEYYESNKFPKQ